jgi:hypothetical protein
MAAGLVGLVVALPFPARPQGPLGFFLGHGMKPPPRPRIVTLPSRVGGR